MGNAFVELEMGPTRPVYAPGALGISCDIQTQLGQYFCFFK